MSNLWGTTEQWEKSLGDAGLIDHFKDYEIPSTLDEILGDGNWEAIFYIYAKNTYVNESVEFLRAVRDFEARGDLNLGQQIYDGFVKEGSPKEVNLPQTKRKPLEAIFGTGGTGFGPPNLFDEAKEEITRLLRNDIFPRFSTSAKAAHTKLKEDVDWDAMVGQGRGRSDAVAEASDFVPAGWHTDPSGRHELRYWDGSDWTDHVSDAGKTKTDPL